MLQGNVCAIVVTFHPDADVLGNLQQVRPQVETLVVVDNGSAEPELQGLRISSASLGFELIENGSNLGIATALNIGVRRARELNSDWILLFDQDSRVTEGFVPAMITAFQEGESAGRRMGILVPTYRDLRLGTPMIALLEADGSIETAMTSGTLMRSALVDEIGLFCDEMFIDGVDHEYSLRVRSARRTIEECSAAVLLHSPGDPVAHHHPFRRKPFYASNYSPIRRYYQERNKLFLVRRYWRRFPAFSRRQFRVTFKDLVKIILFEQNKLPKLRYLLLGWWHGLSGRMGRLR